MRADLTIDLKEDRFTGPHGASCSGRSQVCHAPVNKVFPAWSATTWNSCSSNFYKRKTQTLRRERIAIMQRKHARFVPKANRVLGSEQGDALFGGFLLNRRWTVVFDALQNRSTELTPRASRTGCVRRPYTKSR